MLKECLVRLAKNSKILSMEAATSFLYCSDLLNSKTSVFCRFCELINIEKMLARENKETSEGAQNRVEKRRET